MAQSVQQIIETRKVALLREWAANEMFQVQTDSPAVLGRLAFLNDDTAGQVGPLGRFGSDNVAVVTPSGDPNPHRSSLWVRSRHYQGYAGAYRRFLAEIYKVNLPNAAIPGYQIDHLLNRARSPSAGTFVRVEAVAGDVNQAWGRLFEKVASDPRFFANQARERRKLSWPIAAKIAGLMPPSGPQDSAGINRIADGLVRYGLNRSEAVAGLQNMFNFAYGVRQ